MKGKCAKCGEIKDIEFKMMPSEWESRTGHNPTDEQWEKINAVYMNHPMLSEDFGKDELAYLYNIGGMKIINGMFKTVQDIQRKEAEIKTAERDLEKLQATLELKKKYYWGEY